MSFDAPIGTIIASVLKQDAFEQSLLLPHGRSIPSPLPQPVPGFDARVSLWSPADGRDIQGSAYYVLTKEKQAPDLRGMFLRGSNDFGTAVKARNDGFEDPEGDRNLRHEQRHAFESHHHAVADREPGGSGGSGEPGNEQGLQPITRQTAPTGGAETRPNNVAIAYYIRINA